MTSWNEFDPTWSAAFNAGCDARLQGYDTDACPHPDGSRLRTAWVKGWHDVNAEWGKDSRRPVAPLPPVRGLAEWLAG